MSISSELVEIAPCSAKAFQLRAGDTIRIIDPCGQQVADIVMFAADDFREALSNGRSFDYASTIRLTTGNLIYSNRNRPLAKITADTVGMHDFLLAPCSTDTWRICYDDPADQRPGCFGNLSTALAKFGIDPDDIPTAFNCFMNVALDEAGRLTVLPPISVAGSFIEFQAQLDLIVGLTACSASQSNNGSFKPIHYQIRSLPALGLDRADAL